MGDAGFIGSVVLVMVMDMAHGKGNGRVVMVSCAGNRGQVGMLVTLEIWGGEIFLLVRINRVIFPIDSTSVSQDSQFVHISADRTRLFDDG